MSVVCVCSAPICCDTEQRSASQPVSVASGTRCIFCIQVNFLIRSRGTATNGSGIYSSLSNVFVLIGNPLLCPNSVKRNYMQLERGLAETIPFGPPRPIHGKGNLLPSHARTVSPQCGVLHFSWRTVFNDVSSAPLSIISDRNLWSRAFMRYRHSDICVYFPITVQEYFGNVTYKSKRHRIVILHKLKQKWNMSNWINRYVLNP